MGLVLPRMAPKAMHTEPTQKSALIRLEKGKENCGLIRKYFSANHSYLPPALEIPPEDKEVIRRHPWIFH